MADRTIGELTPAPGIQDDSKFPIEQQGTAFYGTGEQLRKFAEASAKGYVDSAKEQADAAAKSAKEAADSLASIGNSVAEAAQSAEAAKQYSGKPPVIGEDGNWQTWNAEEGGYTGTGKPSRGEAGEAGPQGPRGEKGEKGEKGDAGRGLTVLGQFQSEEELRISVAEPKIGDAYGVGTEAPYDIVIYGDTESGPEWVNHGKLQGARGEPGKDGATGPAGPNTVSTTTTTDITGLLKGNGTAVEQAEAGVDYATPEQLNAKADRTELSKYATKTELEEKQDKIQSGTTAPESLADGVVYLVYEEG